MTDNKEVIASGKLLAPDRAPSPGPMDIVSSMIASGGETDRETIQMLVALYREERAFDADIDMSRALAKFQRECPEVRPDRGVDFSSTKYKYCTLGHIVKSVGEVLAENGISYSFRSTQTSNSKGETILKTTCTLTHENGGTREASLEHRQGKINRIDGVQALGGLNTFLKRYTFLDVTGVALLGDAGDDLVEQSHLYGDTPVPDPIVSSPESSDFPVDEKTYQRALDAVSKDGPVKFEQIKDHMKKKGKHFTMKQAEKINKAASNWKGVI